MKKVILSITNTFKNLNRFFMIAGLLSSLIGSYFLCYGLIISKDDAVRLGKPYPSLGGAKRNEFNFDKYKIIPAVADRWHQSQNAKIGIVFIVIGTIFQAIAIIYDRNDKPQLHNGNIAQVCKNCHFFEKAVRLDTSGETLSLTLSHDERNDLSQIKDYFSVSCRMGVWDQGTGIGQAEIMRIVREIPRKGQCFFWPYDPNIKKFEAARELQKRDQENRELKRSLLYTRVGLWIAGIALIADVFLRVHLAWFK